MVNDDLESLFGGEWLSARFGVLQTGLAVEKNEGVRLLGPVREFVRENLEPEDKEREKLVQHYLTQAKEATMIGWVDGRRIHEKLLRNLPISML